MTDRGTRRAGWYADPLGQADLRWWDSQNWTTQVTASRSKDSRTTAPSRPAALQWADDDLPANEPIEGNSRESSPTAPRVAEPKLAIGAKLDSSEMKPEKQTASGADWSPFALALLSAGDRIVTASAKGIPTITVDMGERTYWWDEPLESFPVSPVDLVVHTTPRADAVKPDVAGRYFEPLLWRVGTAAETLFTRVDPALRYKLRRWPDLDAMPHTAEQFRAIKVLSAAQLTVTELAAIGDIPAKDVRTLIGTFALMSILDAVKDPVLSR